MAVRTTGNAARLGQMGFELLSPQTGQLSVGEAKALEIDVVLHPMEASEVRLEAARSRFEIDRQDELRLPALSRRSRPGELEARLSRLLRKVEAGGSLGAPGRARAEAVESMLVALSSLERIHSQLSGMRRATS